jgi:hypothetical protein
MKPSYSWSSVCRPLLPFALGALAACSGSEPNPSPGSSGSAGIGGNGGSGGSAGSGAGGSAGQAGTPSAGAGGSISGGSGGTGTSGAGPGGGGAGAGGTSTGGFGGGTGGAGGGGTGGSTAGSAGSSGGSNQTFGAAFKGVAQIIQGRCASVCHGQQEGLENRNDLRTADLDAFYTHLTTPLTVDICNGKKLVVPGNVKESLLVVAIKGEENDCALLRMPTNCEGDACVPPTDIQAIESWIAAGAPKN